ncbi:MAG TPA: MMPL family transporter [Solirubrobacteraceae bacterium]
MSAGRCYRWGLLVARHCRLVTIAWTVVLVGCVLLYPSLRGALSAPDYRVAGADSTRAGALLAHYFPAEGDEQDVLVFYSRTHLATQPVFRAVVARALANVRRSPAVAAVLGPYHQRRPQEAYSIEQISTDEHAAIAVLGVRGNARQLIGRVSTLQTLAGRAADAGVQVWLTGYSPIAKDFTNVETTDIERAESIGVPVALVVLVLAFGSLFAAVMPLLLASCGLLLTYGVLALLSHLLRFDISLFTIVTMIGVGIGIDYALFIVSRFREELARQSHTPGSHNDGVAHAVATAIATSGRMVLFSGLIVALSLASLLVVNAPIFREIAVGAVSVVFCTLVAALTLLPAALALAGERINGGALPARLQPANARPTPGVQGGWARWAMLVMRHPVIAASCSAALLIVMALPAFGLRTGINLDFSSLSGTPSGNGERVLANSFAPGALSPIQVVVIPPKGHPLSAGKRQQAEELFGFLAKDTRVAGLIPQQSNGAGLLTVLPSVSIDSPGAAGLVQRIRHELAPRLEADGGPTVLVGGTTAQFVDLSSETRAKFPLVVGLVLGLSLLLLTYVFSSLVLPIKAALMNALATGATIGLVVLVFQNGHGETLLGFSSPGFIQVYLPLSVFALLFGLSMDYEVFLIGRMRETWLRTHDNRLAVASGLEHTARPISAAAAIMVAVFASFLSANVLEIKQFGFALATAVALDATLIRLILVPALMRLLADANWWMPHLKAEMEQTAEGP